MLQQLGDDTRVLDEQENQIDVSQRLYLFKIGYLVEQKQRMEVEMNELRHNNRLLRQINRNISEKLSPNCQDLLNRNQQLESIVIKLSEECSELKASIFLSNQVNLDNQRQQIQTLKNYQHRILQLRKSIQAKQLHIQNLQQQMYSKQKKWQGINFSKLLIFDKIEDINKMLLDYSNKNSKLVAENTKLKQENKRIHEKIQKMERLIVSKCTYLEYKNLVVEKKSKSVPKSKVHVEFRRDYIGVQEKRVRYNPESTCQEKHTMHKFITTENSVVEGFEPKQPNCQVTLLKNIVKFKFHQARQLTCKLTNQEYKIKKLTEQKKALIHSNKVYQSSRRAEVQRANQYEAMFKAMVNYLTKRNPSLTLPIPHDDIPNQPILPKNHLPNTTPHKPTPQQWQCIKQTLDRKLSTYHRPPKPHKSHPLRSYSCLLDYIQTKQPYQQVHSQVKQKVGVEEFSLLLEEFKVWEGSVGIVGSGSGNGKGNKKGDRKGRVEEVLDVFDWCD